MGGVLEDGTEIIKIKGLSKEAIKRYGITFKDMEALLVKDSTRDFSQEKWSKSILDGKITIKDVAYTLRATTNKKYSFVKTKSRLIPPPCFF